MLGFGLNQVTVPRAPLDDFTDLAVRLGCVGIELRNDLGRPLFDGMSAAAAGDFVRSKGLRLLGLSQVYPFNVWSNEIAQEVRALIADAAAAGAETISLIPCNDGTHTAEAERRTLLHRAMEQVLPMLEAADLVALIEPLGFPRSSLRLKSELVEAIDDLDGRNRFRLVHDTFHHTLAGGGPIYPELTGIVHVSAVVDPSISVEQMEDEHRVLIGPQDRLDNVGQIAGFLEAGYSGAFSFECFSPEVWDLADPESAIRSSIEFISSRVTAQAA